MTLGSGVRIGPYEIQSTLGTHRKVLVVDGEIGFTGGAGIADHWLGNARTPEEWRPCST